MAVEVGAAFISVRPSLQGFHRTVDREMRRMAPQMLRIGREWGAELQKGIKEKLNPIEVRLDAGRTAVQLATLNRNLDKLDGRRVQFNVAGDFGAAFFDVVELQAALRRIDGKRVQARVHVEMSGALAELRLLEQILARIDNRTVRIRINADLAAALARLATAEERLRRLDGQTAHANVDVDTRGAIASLSRLQLALAAVSATSLLIGPQIAAVGAGIVGLAAPLAAGAVGFGGLAAVAVPAIMHVREATQQQAQASKSAGQAATQAQSRAFAQAGAQQQLAAAIRSAAQQHEQAMEQVRQAELQVADAQRSARQAQEDLTRARVEARRALQDMKLQLIDAGLAVEEQQIAVQESRAEWQGLAQAAATAAARVAAAQQQLAKAQAAQQQVLADSAATDGAKRQAQANVDAAKAAVKSARDGQAAADLAAKKAETNYRQSVQRLKEQQLQLQRLTVDERAASKAGVDGSDQVRSARDRLAEANRRISETELGLAQARANVARTDQQSADQIASARRAMAQANMQAAASTSALGGKMVKLTALERQLQVAWQGLTGAFNTWAKALQPAVLPLLIRGIGLLKQLLPALTPIVIAAAQGVGILLDKLQAGLQSPFFKQFAADLAKWAGPAIVGLGQLVGNLLKAFAGLAQGFAPIGFALLKALNSLVAGFANVTTNLTNNRGFQEFANNAVQILSDLGTHTANFFAQVGPLIGTLLHALSPLIGALRQVIFSVAEASVPVLGLLAAALAKLGPALAPVITVVGQFVVQVIKGLLPSLTPLVNVIGQVAAQVAGALAQALQQALPSLVQIVAAVGSLIPQLTPLVSLIGQWFVTLLPLVPLIARLVAVNLTALLPVLTLLVKLWVQSYVIAFKLLIPVIRLLVTVLTWLAAIAIPILQALGVAIRWLGAAAVWLWEKAIRPVFTFIATLAKWLYSIVAFVVIAPLILQFKLLAAIATWLWKNVFGPVWRGIVTLHKQAWAGIKPIIYALGAGIRYVWMKYVAPAFDGMRLAVAKLAPHFRNAVDSIRHEWDKLKAAAKGPVSFVVNSVFNSGIVKIWDAVAKLVPGMQRLEPIRGFAEGGIYPGYTPGRDIGFVGVSGGEAIMRPEWTRAVGPGFVDGANAAARHGGVGGVEKFMQSAFGGNFFLGGIVGKFEKAAQGFFAKGLKKTAAAAFHPLLALSDRSLGDSGFGQLAAGIPHALVAKILEFFGPLESKIGGDAKGVVAAAKKYIGIGDDRGPNNNRFSRAFGMPGAPWCAMFVSTAIKDAHATKHYKGAPTAAVASFVSGMKHVGIGAGRPGDLAAYRGTGHVNLIESKAGGGYMTIGGNQNAVVQRGVRGGQSSILRPTFARGGIVSDAFQIFTREAPRNADPHEDRTPLVQLFTGLDRSASRQVASTIVGNRLEIGHAGTFDSGGWLPPGLSTIYNGTGQPEAVLTNAQLAALASGASGGMVTEYHGHFDGMTKAAYEAQMRAGFTAMQVQQAQRDRTGRRR